MVTANTDKQAEAVKEILLKGGEFVQQNTVTLAMPGGGFVTVDKKGGVFWHKGLTR